MTVFDELCAIYVGRGAALYFGETVTVSDHCLQAASFAHAARAPETLIVAALLHDIGHLIEPASEQIADWNHDARHELSGSAWLAARFGAAVWQPVRLHVAAKRYLCATEPAYLGQLSAASVVTLGLQGGPMSAAEQAAFEAEPHHRDALLLRRWDDQGKIPGLPTADFIHYRPMIEQLVAA